MPDATDRAAHDVLAHGLRGDLAYSAVGVELGAVLQSGTAADVHDGATPGEVLQALRKPSAHIAQGTIVGGETNQNVPVFHPVGVAKNAVGDPSIIVRR